MGNSIKTKDGLIGEDVSVKKREAFRFHAGPNTL
ncbi:hypothetical protein P7H16_20125 [Paenibacillus larvae]|nr:hypothetical protein [Paenibacillus larvae]MDT2248755.1 hypothetical protein [Paenibacillus larvae]